MNTNAQTFFLQETTHSMLGGKGCNPAVAVALKCGLALEPRGASSGAGASAFGFTAGVGSDLPRLSCITNAMLSFTRVQTISS